MLAFKILSLHVVQLCICFLTFLCEIFLFCWFDILKTLIQILIYSFFMIVTKSVSWFLSISFCGYSEIYNHNKTINIIKLVSSCKNTLYFCLLNINSISYLKYLNLVILCFECHLITFCYIKVRQLIQKQSFWHVKIYKENDILRILFNVSRKA